MVSEDFKNSADGQVVFDKVIVGAGPVGLFNAYEILRQAEIAGKKLKVAVIAEVINSPTAAGSQPFYGIDGNYHEGQPAKPEVDALLRKGMKGFYDMIEREKISCREAKGLEIKARSSEALESLLKLMTNNNIVDDTDPIRWNSDDQIFTLKDHPHSIIFDGAGQVNLPELQEGLIDKIRAMGGHVIDGVRYERSSKQGQHIIVHTNKGHIETNSKPLLVTGATHLLNTPGLKGTGQPIYTMSIVHGPLDAEDRARIAKGPIAFANEDLDGDFLWGALDEKGYFSFGKGDTADPDTKSDMEAELLTDIEKLYPGLIEKYATSKNVSYGTMYKTNNDMPVVGRFADFDVASGWGGRGIIPGFAQAQAYAQYVVHNNDHDLQVFEKMQPDLPFPANAQSPETAFKFDKN